MRMIEPDKIKAIIDAIVTGAVSIRILLRYLGKGWLAAIGAGLCVVVAGIVAWQKYHK